MPRARGRYGWSTTRYDYPVLTLADLRRLAYCDEDASYRRTRAAILWPWSDLPDVVLVPNETDAQTGARGYRLLPAEAAAWLLRGSDGEGGSRHARRYATRPTRSVSRSCRSAVRLRVRFCRILFA